VRWEGLPIFLRSIGGVESPSRTALLFREDEDEDNTTNYPLGRLRGDNGRLVQVFPLRISLEATLSWIHWFWILLR